jgi:hypothetical protein
MECFGSLWLHLIFIAVVKDVNRHVFSRERGFTVKDIHVGYGGTTVPFVLHGIEDEEEEQSPIEIEFDGKLSRHVSNTTKTPSRMIITGEEVVAVPMRCKNTSRTRTP